MIINNILLTINYIHQCLLTLIAGLSLELRFICLSNKVEKYFESLLNIKYRFLNLLVQDI